MVLIPGRWIVAALVCSIAISQSVMAGPLDELATKIAAIVKQQNESTVIVGNFAGPPLSDGAGGAIGKDLADALKAVAKIDVQPNAKIAISGSYSVAKDDQDRLQIEVEVDIKNSKTGKRLSSASDIVPAGSGDKAPAGKPVVRIAAKDMAEVQLLALVATSCDLPTNLNGKERENIIAETLDSGTKLFVGKKNEIRTSSSSPFGIAVAVFDASGQLKTLRPNLDERGQAFIELREGDRYIIRLINDSKLEAAGNVTVDGVSVFSFSDKPKSQFLVASQKSMDVKGWVRNESKGQSFQIARNTPELEELFGTVDQSSIGAITVSFSAAWPKNQLPPEDERGMRSRGLGDLRTTLGEDFKQTLVQVPRDIGQVRSTLTIRYNKPRQK